LDLAITIFWLVGITNAINLLDNMDGLAAGIAAIAAVFLAVIHAGNGQFNEAVILTAFAAALAGFLIYNFSPASIFMGDCGALFVGFFLASSALTAVSGGRSRTLLPVLAVPVLILLLPIFDTTLVTILRKLTGRAVSQGGRDHTSHRLVALGLSERQTVSLLYAFSVLAGLLALQVRELPLGTSVAAIGSFTVVLALAGTCLAKVGIYEETEVSATHSGTPADLSLGCCPARFVDAPSTEATSIHGLCALGGNCIPGEVLRSQQTDEAVVSGAEPPEERSAEIRVEFEKANVTPKGMRMHTEDVIERCEASDSREIHGDERAY
jgi:hypothetical protein